MLIDYAPGETPINGSIGGITFANPGTQNWARKKTSPVQPKTQFQYLALSRLTKLSRQFAYDFNPFLQGLWITFGENVGCKPGGGPRIFNEIGNPDLWCGFPVSTVPPGSKSPTTNCDITINLSAPATMSLTTEVGCPITDPQVYYIFATPPTGNVNKVVLRETRFIDCVEIVGEGTKAFNIAYTDRFGRFPTSGEWVGFFIADYNALNGVRNYRHGFQRLQA